MSKKCLQFGSIVKKILSFKRGENINVAAGFYFLMFSRPLTSVIQEASPSLDRDLRWNCSVVGGMPVVLASPCCCWSGSRCRRSWRWSNGRWRAGSSFIPLELGRYVHWNKEIVNSVVMHTWSLRTLEQRNV